ncbi:metaxin 1, partial [Coemansia spiralis]
LKGHAEQRLKASGVDADSSDLAAPDAGHAPAPLGAKLPRIYLLAKGGFQRHADRSAHPVYQRAAEFLAVLSQKLGNKQFFFGDRPTTLDAVVYGHLWPVIRVELPQDTLRTIVMGKHANLVAHCERVNALLERPVAASTQGVVAGVAAAAKQCIIRYVALPARPLQTAQDNPQCAEEIRSVTGAMLVFLGYVIYNGIVSAPAPRKALADAPLDRPLDAASVLSPLRTT